MKSLIELIDDYAESRHVNGDRSYNAKTAAARKLVEQELAKRDRELACLNQQYLDTTTQGVTMSNLTAAEMLLRDLVNALDNAFISTWQSTHAWQQELDAAREYLEEREE